MKIVIISGSKSDDNFVQKIRKLLTNVDNTLIINTHIASAHKNTIGLLDIIIEEEDDDPKIIFITVAGLSNALSGVVAANTQNIVIACPVFANPTDYLIDIHSTLRMPSGVPVLTVLSPENCVLAVKRILASWS